MFLDALPSLEPGPYAPCVPHVLCPLRASSSFLSLIRLSCKFYQELFSLQGPFRQSCYTWTYGLCGNGGREFGTKEECFKPCRERECRKRCKKNNKRGSTSKTSKKRASCYTWTYGLCGNGGRGFGTKEECFEKCKLAECHKKCKKIE